MLEIKTNQFKTRKKVLIDGNEYTVRKMGNIEQLDLSQYMRRLKQLSDIEVSDKKLTVKQIDEVDMLSSKILALYIGLFDDGADQSKSKSMLATLTDTELGMMLEQIFTEDITE